MQEGIQKEMVRQESQNKIHQGPASCSWPRLVRFAHSKDGQFQSSASEALMRKAPLRAHFGQVLYPRLGCGHSTYKTACRELSDGRTSDKSELLALSLSEYLPSSHHSCDKTSFRV